MEASGQLHSDNTPSNHLTGDGSKRKIPGSVRDQIPAI